MQSQKTGGQLHALLQRKTATGVETESGDDESTQCQIRLRIVPGCNAVCSMEVIPSVCPCVANVKPHVGHRASRRCN